MKKNNTAKKVVTVTLAGLLICTTTLGTVAGVRSVYAQEATESTSEVNNTKVDEAEVKEEAAKADQTDAQEQETATDPVEAQEVPIDKDETTAKAELPVVQIIPEVKAGVTPTSSLEDLGVDTTELKSLMAQTQYALDNPDVHTPASYALFLAGGDMTPQQNLAGAQAVLDKTDWINEYVAQSAVSRYVEELSYCLNLLVLAETPEPEVKVNVTINYVSPENGTINTLTQEAIEGKPFTATAPDTFTQSTGPKFYRTSDASQTIASASEGAVITFNYEKIMPTMNDVIVDGPSTAKVGDTVNYRMESTTHFNFGDPRIDYLEFEAGHPVTISDPSAAEITAGSVKFLKAGTYTLAGAAVSEPFTVTVTEDVVTPDPVVVSTEWIVTAPKTTVKPGESLTIGVTEKVTYDNGEVAEKPITLPLGSYFTSTDEQDSIANNKVTFGMNTGERTVSIESTTRAAKTVTGLKITVSKDTTPEKPGTGGDKPGTGGNTGGEKPGTGGSTGSGTGTNKPGTTTPGTKDPVNTGAKDPGKTTNVDPKDKTTNATAKTSNGAAKNEKGFINTAGEQNATTLGQIMSTIAAGLAIGLFLFKDKISRIKKAFKA